MLDDIISGGEAVGESIDKRLSSSSSSEFGALFSTYSSGSRSGC